tara:strand:- start:281 stop:442 length:162 start_codon:yes stop_codon:yes gene_type:complete
MEDDLSIAFPPKDGDLEVDESLSLKYLDRTLSELDMSELEWIRKQRTGGGAET